ncbi:MAG: carboxypeptidase regulatory-like domain-containing protein [Catalinimonas sp.]
MSSWIRSSSLASLAALLMATAACRSLTNAGTSNCAAPLQQGLRGVILYREGNLMPGPDMDADAAAGRPVVREVVVHPLTSYGDVTRDGDEPTFFTAIATERIATLRSDSTGCFQVSLPVGSYSLFVREGDRYYANRFDGDGMIFPVRVVEDEVTAVEFSIDWDATY